MYSHIQQTLPRANPGISKNT